MKYSYEKKLATVKLVLASGYSTCEAARMIGSEQKHIRRWVALYLAHGESGLRIKGGRYSGEFKLSVIRHMYENQLSLFETAVRFGIPADSTVLSWDRAYRREGAAGLYRDNRKKMKQLKKPKPPSAHPDEALQRELEYLRAENAYLKKLKVLVAARIARERGRKPPPSRG